jgi:hypothetical protein
MRFKNFEITGWIELRTGNLYWDVHNFADFGGLELNPANDAVIMKWTVPKRDNPWGCYENKFSGMNLYFDDLQFLKIGPRDPDMPFTEDACVSHILKVDPNIQHDDPFIRARKVWGPDEPYRLVFLFQSARVIELESKTVELIPVP